MNLTEDLKNILAGEVDDSESGRQAASRDASLFSATPKAVVFPRHVQDISALVHFATRHKRSLTVRSGGTDMSGGPLGHDIVVAMPKHFNRIHEIKNHTVTVDPCVWYRDLEAALAPKNLLLPTYPASKDICTVGGMVANNSAGEKTLSYGETADYVRTLHIALSDGQEYMFEALSRSELDAKLSQDNFEGEIYRRTFKLIEDNYDVIQRARPNVSKNSAGYALWDVWNRERQIFDLTRLFSGSQGTLGIITNITFGLVTPRPHSQMLVLFLRDLAPLAEIVKTVLTYAPESFESYDDHTLRLAIRFLPALMRKMKTRNLLSLLLSFAPEFKMVLTGGLPQLVLLAEFTGHEPQEIAQRVQAAQAALRHFAVQMYPISSPAEASKYWTIRRESFNLLREHAQGAHAAPFIDDIIVNPQYLPEFLPRLNEILSHYDLTYTIAGHVGDGNFHIIPLMDVSRPDFAETIEKLSNEVYDLVLEYKGSAAAEHNDGLIRSHYLKKMFGEQIYNLFVETKNIFDPNNIFNPGKKVGADWEKAKKYLIKN
ncbi:MAG: FAD-binding oxidoreductase [Patescibacteria group bacterium]